MCPSRPISGIKRAGKQKEESGLPTTKSKISDEAVSTNASTEEEGVGGAVSDAMKEDALASMLKNAMDLYYKANAGENVMLRRMQLLDQVIKELEEVRQRHQMMPRGPVDPNFEVSPRERRGRGGV